MDGIYLVAYLLGYAAMYPRIFRYALDDVSMGRPHKDDVMFAGFISIPVTLMWPVIVIGLLLDRFVFNPIAERVMEGYKRD